MVAHDAGSSRLIQSWISRLGPQLRFCVAGPALSLFESEHGALPKSNLHECLKGCQLVISGTGWMSSLEHDGRMLAKSLRIPCIAVLDHWVNYMPRFQRRGETIYPDALWVADEEAASLAEKIFDNIPIIQLPNHWLEELKISVSKERGKIGHRKTVKPAKNLLYLLEPIRDHESGIENNKEFLALDFWLKKLPELIASGVVAQRSQLNIKLRQHPSEPSGKYNTWISHWCDMWPVTLDKNVSLAKSIATADIVFGCETQALVAAMACDIPAFSTIPPSEPPCRLPHIQLQKL